MAAFGYDEPPDDIFDFSKPFEKVYLPGGQTEGYIQCDESSIVSELEERPYQGQEYAEEFRMRERMELQRGYEVEQERERERARACGMGMDDIEITSGGTARDVHELEETTDIYDKYYNTKKSKSRVTNLLISDFRKNILSLIQSNEVIIITGPTGCGKTTQVPQYILDDYAEKKLYCNIAVTQPRRIAAISIAKRVCEEKGWSVGGICGYQVGQKLEKTEDTRLTYMTTKVFLNQVVKAKDLKKYTHIILDEIHERDLKTDLALLVVKKLLATNSRNVKIILMSATVDAAKFAGYYQRVLQGVFTPAPVLKIKKQRLYPIQIHYLEELDSLGQLPIIEYEEPNISETAINICIKLIKQFDKIDTDPKNKKSVLVFLPGLAEIEELHAKLSDPKVVGPLESLQYKFQPIPLHSSITHEEQANVFKNAYSGYRKIILATNIAESSITVPDVKFVIDFCLTKVLVTDPVSNFTSLQLAWTSKANCEQRAGRVGRVMEGKVYRMVPKEFYDNYLDEECVPEMLRCPLEEAVLLTKMLDEEPKALLGLALDPPKLSDIERTILVLKEAGGLLLTSNGIATPFDGDITFLGRLMAELPLEIHLTRLIAFGYIFSLLEDCIVMAAAMNLKSLFSNPFKEKMKSYDSKLTWADSSCSDCIALLNVYELWQRHVKTGVFERSAGSSLKKWAARHFIQLKVLKEVEILVLDITNRLRRLGIEEFKGRSKVRWDEFERALVLKMIIAGAFYPNYFGRGGRGGQVDEPGAVKTLGGRDPYTTVYLTGFPREQPPHLYSQLIRQELADCREDMRITYDGSTKVYIEFRRSEHKMAKDENYDDTIPGKISMAVYRAVKLRQIKKYIEIRVLSPHEAKKKAEKLKIDVDRDVFSKLNKRDADETPMETDSESVSSASSATVRPFSSNLPSVDVNTLNLEIVYFRNPSQFWANHADHRSKNYQRKILEKLNDGKNHFPPFLKSPELGDMCIAPYKESEDSPTIYYRARIDAVDNDGIKVKVFFIDYGNSELINVNELLDYGEMFYDLSSYPMQAFQCVLANIKPSVVKNRNGSWSKEAKNFFKNEVENHELYAEIYSVVNGVVAIQLKKKKPTQRGANVEFININDRLVEKGFAEPDEESYLSKANHEVRQRSTDFGAREVFNSLQDSDSWSENRYDPPDRRECKLTLQLRGPASPLEMKIFSYARGALSKEIKISQDSVNSVLLDADPQDPHERLVVAAHVSQNQSNSALILHSTTIMPNIHGLAALIPFIFAPAVELRVTDDRTRYTGILCGLGVDHDGKFMFPEHDMELPFDVEFTQQDLEDINRVRYLMSTLLFTHKNEERPELSERDILEGQSRIKKFILELVCRKRKSQEVIFSRRQYFWGLTKPDIKIQDKSIHELNKRYIFRLHPGIEIKPESEEIVEKKKHNDYLYRIAGAGLEKWEPIECELCCVTLLSIPSLRIHLNSQLHKNKETALYNQF